jgi:flagellar hook-length control protein FliK
MGRSVPSLGKAASASQASLALAAMGGALSARALQAVTGVRASGGAGPGGVGSTNAIGDATDAPRGKAGPATGNRPGFASVLERITSSRVSRNQTTARDSIVAGLSAQPLAPSSDSSDAPGAIGGTAPAVSAGRSGSRSRMRRDAAAGMRAVSRLSKALDRARGMNPSDGSNAAAAGAMRQADQPSPMAQATGQRGRNGEVGSGDGDGGSSVVSPDAALQAVDDAAARVEAAVATGDPGMVATVVADVSKSLPDSIRVLLGQAAVALAGEAGALDLGMLMVGAFDGSVADLPTLTGTPADQSSLAGLLVALRQVGATLEVGAASVSAAVDVTNGVALDGAGVFAALASALASAASADEATAGDADLSATGPALPVPADAVAEAQVATVAVVDTPVLSDVEGAPVIAVAEGGVATVVPIVAHVAGKAGQAGSAGAIVGADAAATAAAEVPGDASGDTTVASVTSQAAAASLAGAGGAGAAEGEQVGGVPAQGASTPGAGGAQPVAGSGIAPDARIRNADAPGIASTAQATSPVFDLDEQVSPVLVRLAKLTGVGEAKQFTLRLTPDNLGPLSIRLTLRQGALGVDLTTASPEARKALEAALPQLRASLNDAGLRLERLDVGLRDRDETAGRNASQQGNQTPQRQSGEPGGQAQAGTGDGGREWAATFFGRLQFDQDGRPFEVPASMADEEAQPVIAPPSRDFVRVVGGETALSVTRALGVQSRVSAGLGAYGGRRSAATAAVQDGMAEG